MRHVGTALILFSLLVFVFIYFPLVALFFHPKMSASALNGFSITIPRIQAQAPVVENVNAFDEASYTIALKNGVAHARGTALPGQKGMTFLFAHSSGLPWEITRINAAFLRLGELKEKDEIIIRRNQQTYIYRVHAKKEVWPQEVGYLLDTRQNELILQTCTPAGTSLKRLLIFADPV